MISQVRGHTQTLLGHLLPSPKVQGRPERILLTLQDGDQLSCRLYEGSSEVVISLFHGLSGSVEADYMQRTARQYLQQGHTVFLVNHRGAGDGGGLAQKPYHSGRAEDASQVIAWLRSRYPGKKQVAAGFSLSGNILLYLAGRWPREQGPDALISVNAPIHLHACSEALQKGFNRCYDFRFVLRILEERNLPYSPWMRLADLDEVYTAPASGFRNRDHYYETCSSKPHVHRIQIPACVLAAEDDPFVPVQDYREAAWAPSVHLTLRKSGGHLGYLSLKKNKLGNRRWLDQYMVDSLDHLLQRINP